MYHIELRQFPHNFCRFNLSESELRVCVLDAWARQEGMQLGDRRWDPRQAGLTVIEGPRLSMQELSMGRGWRSACRSGSDVTERVLASARAAQDTSSAKPATGATLAKAQPPAQSASQDSEAASLASELLARLGADAVPLVRAWMVALERHPDRPPSECLLLAEELVRR